MIVVEVLSFPKVKYEPKLGDAEVQTKPRVASCRSAKGPDKMVTLTVS